jgi:carbon-monoxide dehydrogenase medium subunit
MVTGVSLPKPSPGAGTSFLNLGRTRSDIAKMCVAVALTVQDGICREVRIAMGAAAPTIIRATKAEGALTGQKPSSQAIVRAARTASEETRPITDIRSTAEYRKEMANVLVRRAIERALEKAKA